MVDFEDRDPQFPERESSSLLKTGIAATPLVAGVYNSLQGIHVDGTLKQPREAGIDQAMRQHAKSRRMPRIPTIEEMNRFMRAQSGGVNRQAWKWAVDSVDPFTRKRMLSFTEHMNSMSDPELQSAIAQTFQRNSSLGMETVWRRFSSNVSALSGMDTMPNFLPVNQLGGLSSRTVIPMAGAMPTNMLTSINRIAGRLGTSVTPRGITTADLAGQGFGMWNVRFQTQVGDVNLRLPNIVGGILHEGSTLQTRRIAPDILYSGADGLVRMNRTDFFLKEFEESILPDIGTRLQNQDAVERAVKQLRGKVFGELEATAAVDPSVRTAAQAQREALRALAVQVVEPSDRSGFLEYRPTWKTPSASTVTDIMASPEGRAMGLRGGIGPGGLTKGMLSTADWERFYLGEVDYSRRPEQRFRQYQATEESMKRLGQYNQRQKYKAMQMVGDNIAYNNVAKPRLKAAYVSPAMHGKILEGQAMGEGESVVRASAGGMLEFEEAKTLRLIEAREDIGDFSSLKPGSILGRNAAGGIVRLPQGSSVVGTRGIAGDQMHVDIMQKHKFRHGDKIFGGAKAVSLFRSEKEFGNFLSQVHASDADIIINMDELRKNRSLHKTQIISSLEEMVRGTFGGPGTGLNRKFYMGQGEEVARLWASRNPTHEGFVQQAMRQAIQSMGLTPGEFGNVFGATGHVLGDNQTMASMVRKAAVGLPTKQVNKYIKAASRGVAGGMADITYGGPRFDVGGLGSLEPRAFDIINEGQFGETGSVLSREFMERLAYTNPESQIAGMEIGKTLSSIAGEGSVSGRAWTPGTNFQQFIESGGGVLKPGHGLPNIHIPGADIMNQLRPFETATGVNARGAVSDIYHNMARNVAALQEGEMDVKEFQRQMEYSAGELLKEGAPGGKGAGSIMRGKVAGSRFLRGVSSMGSASTAMKDPYSVGITAGAFESMLGEISDMYGDDPGRIEQMRKRFRAGEGVGGILARHPFLGGFSLQAVEYKMVEGSDDLMVLPEIKQNFRVRAGNGEFVSKELTLGPLAGLAGDKDADAYSAMLVSPRTEEQLRNQIIAKDSEFVSRYTQHQVRMQLFKAGKARKSDSMSTVATMIAETEKLRTGQEWIGKLSTQMTETKRALTQFGQGAAAADARFLLEWLEQTPISAKHMSAEQAQGGGLEALMMSITNSMEERNVARLQGNIEQIVKDDAVASAMLKQTVHIDPNSAAQIGRITGAQVNSMATGIDINRALHEMMRARGEADATGMSRMSNILTGKGSRVKMREIAELSVKGAFFDKMPSKGIFSSVASAASQASNTLGALGRGMIRHHKAIGFGFAGSMALSAILSEPPETVGTGRAKIPNSGVNMNLRKGANRLRPEDLQPPGQTMGSPSVSQQMRNQTVRLAPGEPKQVGARVHMSVPQNSDMSGITRGLTGLGKNTSVNLRDNRKDLHPHEIGSKLL